MANIVSAVFILVKSSDRSEVPEFHLGLNEPAAKPVSVNAPSEFHGKEKADSLSWFRFARLDLSGLIQRVIRSFVAPDMFELSTNKAVRNKKR
jgi:hypothetical protein